MTKQTASDPETRSRPVARTRRRRPSLYRTALSLAIAAVVAAWLPFSVFYIAALNKRVPSVSAISAPSSTTGTTRVVTTASGATQLVAANSATRAAVNGSACTDRDTMPHERLMVDPTHQVFWFASRAFGIVAMVLLGGLGRGRSGDVRPTRAPPRPTRKAQALSRVSHPGDARVDRRSRRTCCYSTLISVLGSPESRSRLRSATARCSPASGSSRLARGGPRAQLLRRKWIGVKTWRFMHRFTIIVVPARAGPRDRVGHRRPKPLDGRAADRLTAPIVFAFTYRMLPPAPRRDPRPASV